MKFTMLWLIFHPLFFILRFRYTTLNLALCGSTLCSPTR